VGDVESIGTRIKQLRAQNNVTQAQLGAHIGVQRAAIQKYEDDSVANIPMRSVVKISQFFNVSPQFLLGLSDENLVDEVALTQAVSRFHGKNAVELLGKYSSLNREGKDKLLSLADDLCASNKYQS
jgi:transcriptional regulator with XRE-family HTH domain